ncbi:MAG TPA: D-alanyl-D-alanine carboxypeptidase/D-alanyl-D-alanine-endopeptidase [Mycobacteriales bacterium]|nr:D-alanyl-D-alanine carboxypeptidase/D-alanyl-D-alanine-endopeptidase [Mycobacteriales bacterium]
MASRSGTLLIALLAACTLAAGAGAVVLQRTEAPPATTATPAPRAAPSRPPLLPRLREGAAISAPAVGAAVAASARGRPAGRLAISVLDVVSGTPLVDTFAGVPIVPASTAKLVTAAAVLAKLPPEQTLVTKVVAGATPGDVVFVGGGDTTLAKARGLLGYPRRPTVADLASRVRKALGTTPVRRVLVDDHLYVGPRLGPGWKPSYVTGGAVAPVSALAVDGARIGPKTRGRHADPALAAGAALAALLSPGRPPPVLRGRAVPGAVELARVQSAPVWQLVGEMLSRSDNDLAESLARQLALATGEPANFAGAAAAVRAAAGPVLVRSGVTTGTVALVDASGLSPGSRLQPVAVSRLLALAAREGGPLSPLVAGLPVAGFDGTLVDRFRAGATVPAAGVVRAKTGTLLGVSALAGLLRTREGRLLSFHLTLAGVPPGATRAAERSLDSIATALVACGCR